MLLMLLCLTEHLASSYQKCVASIHLDKTIYLKMDLNVAKGSFNCHEILEHISGASSLAIVSAYLQKKQLDHHWSEKFPAELV